MERFGIANHIAMMNAEVEMSKEVQSHIDREILWAVGVKQKDLKDTMEGNKTHSVQEVSHEVQVQLE